jgi:precorrin-2 dehydrogenase/sirohydrochlorin ferrochelatase
MFLGKRTGMKLYHVAMNIQGKPAMVFGGGQVALRKVRALLECGAVISIVSPAIEPELERMAREGQVQWIARHFDESLMDDGQPPLLVFGTTDQRDVNVRIYQAAVKRRIPCNIADVPELCTFTVPATVSRGPLSISVSTSGMSPALARRIREELEIEYGPEYGFMTRILGDLRQLILRNGKSSDENRALFFEIVDSDLLSALREGDTEWAVEILRGILPATIDPEPVVRNAVRTCALPR